MKGLAGRVCLVTGGSRGIGAAIARRLDREGARVALTYRGRAADAERVAGELRDALALRMDVCEPEDVRRSVERVVERFGRLDVLVNNAGFLEPRDFFEIDDEALERTLDVNLKGPFRCTREAGRLFREQGAGAVVNVSSVGGQFGGPRAAHYAAAKAAVLSLTRSCARILAPFGVRVNAVAPGFVRTEMIEPYLAAGEAELVAEVPLGRIAEPSEVAAAVAFLASDESAFMTGHVLNVNGGQWMA